MGVGTCNRRLCIYDFCETVGRRDEPFLFFLARVFPCPSQSQLRLPTAPLCPAPGRAKLQSGPPHLRAPRPPGPPPRQVASALRPAAALAPGGGLQPPS